MTRLGLRFREETISGRSTSIGSEGFRVTSLIGTLCFSGVNCVPIDAGCETVPGCQTDETLLAF